jgi:flagellar biosynthetic protein FlhB
MANDQGEKTEKPSAKRLKDARERGQITRSRELGMAAASLAATSVLVAYGASMLSRLLGGIASGVARLGHAPDHDLMPSDITGMILAGGSTLALVVGPIALAAAGTSVMAALGQGGFNFAPKALTPNWSRLNPANGIKRLGFKQSGTETLKVSAIVTVITILAWHIGTELFTGSARLVWMTPAAAGSRGWSTLIRLLWQASFAVVAFGGLDYGLQRWRLMSSLKMSRQEVKDELRSSEGNPEIKARVRRVQRDMARRRTLQATKKATVIITNPTHFAVALQYRRERNAAPIVVAKGQDLLAASMRGVARDHAVPIIENPPLARALYKGAEVGDTIPADLFGAVAEVLAYLVRLKQLTL